MASIRTAAICGLLCMQAGCADTRPEPVMVSAAGLPGYAISYPDRLGAETTLLVADKEQAMQQSEQLRGRVGELKPGADPNTLLVVVRQADEAGRTEAFARSHAEARGVRTFWDEERGPISARVNGAAQKQLSEGNCGACSKLDLGGSLGYAVGAGVDKQLEKRLRASNEAHRTIEYNKDLLGTAHVASVQKLADDIALTSYQVNVALPQARDRIDALLAERDEVDATLTRAIEWEREHQTGKLSAGEKRQSQERLAILDKSRASLAPAVTAAQAARQDLDAFIEDVRTRYAATLDALQLELEAAAEQAGPR